MVPGARMRCVVAALLLATFPAPGAAPALAPPSSTSSPGDARSLDKLSVATRAVVGIRVQALANARSNATLGPTRSGSGVLLAAHGLVLTIGYLVLEADQVEIVTAGGRTMPATVAAYDPATGFGLLRPYAPLGMKGIALGDSARVKTQERLLVAAEGGEDSLSVATVIARRPFTAYWEYLLDNAIFTAPPRPDFGGAALIDRDGELVGIGSLFVMDAETPGERSPGNLFVPVELLKPILEEMAATGRQKGGARPWLGLSSIEDDGVLRVIRVASDGPAELAGIAAGDTIVAIAGEKVQSLEAFYRRLWASGAPGVTVVLKVLRGGEARVVRVHSIDRLDHIRRKPAL